MTLDNLKKHYKYYSFLASGQFSERNFDKKIEAKNISEEAGRHITGEMSPSRRNLIISDAKRHLENLKTKLKARAQYLKDKGLPQDDLSFLEEETKEEEVKEDKPKKTIKR